MPPEEQPPELDPSTDRGAVLAANQAFYDAFEARDLDAMSDLWAHDDRVICVHPGWTELRGWASVASSWAALFGGPQRLQFIVTDEHVVLAGDVAWVSCDENLLAATAAPPSPASTCSPGTTTGRGRCSPTTARRSCPARPTTRAPEAVARSDAGLS